jgi:glutathione synthase/RimK-type ligase-like ATP-grasp enzyme
VSLLAEARGQRALPTLQTIRDIKDKRIARVVVSEIDDVLQRLLEHETQESVEVRAVFGQSLSGGHGSVARQLFRLFPAPFLQATLSRQKNGTWVLASITSFSTSDVLLSDYPRIASLVEDFLAKRHVAKTTRQGASFDLAILHDPREVEPPSDARALRRFEKAATRLGLSVEFVQKEDYKRLGEFDALFIRETTYVHNHTYRFARRAVAEGLAVIDDPISILRCTNKVYLAELLTKAAILIPETVLIHRGNLTEAGQRLGYPCVLKLPDSSFSQGVVKVDTEEELRDIGMEMFATSELLVAQRYLRTEFDWRVGVFDNKVLYVCRYHMARRHWQVVRRGPSGAKITDGESDAVPVDEAPPSVVETALAAARLIGDGLYGVDLKEVDGKVLVIEVNDNPSIDAGVEDALAGQQLYDTIMEGLVERIERLRGLEKRAVTS